MLKLKFLWIVLAFAGAFIFTSCKKSSDQTDTSYKCTTCKATPDALAANDGSSKGIYKGIIVGSSGTITFDIMNNGSTISATAVLDGTTIALTSSISWQNGSAYIAPFTGTLNGAPVSITFSVNANGGSPSVTASNIPGHPNAQLMVIKETSTSLVECFEGTYQTSRSEKGTFNILLSRAAKLWGGVSREDGSNEPEDVDGTINGNNELIMDGTTIGTLSGDQINGKFTDSDGTLITFSGKRTL